MSSSNNANDKKAAAQHKFLNTLSSKRRRTADSCEAKRTSTIATSAVLPSSMMVATAAKCIHSEEELTRLAIEELAREASRGADRAKTLGPSGWLPTPRTNKRFLSNTIRSVVAHNRRQTEGRTNVVVKDEADLDAIIAAGKRRERKLLIVGDAKYSFRKPPTKPPTDSRPSD